MTVAVQGVIEYNAFSRWSILLVPRKNHPFLLSNFFLLVNILTRLFCCCFAFLFGIFIAVRIITRIRSLVRVKGSPFEPLDEDIVRHTLFSPLTLLLLSSIIPLIIF